MILGIDASNLRDGGGVTHLCELLKAADPTTQGFRQIILWSNRNTLAQLPSDKPWLTKIHEPLLDQALLYRLYWQWMKLPILARQAGCDALFLPGGGSGHGFRPYITMSQNLLPFESSEYRRYGWSWMRLRLFLLRHAQTQSFRHADGLILLTNYARQTVMTRIQQAHGRWIAIPHGINPQFYQSPRVQYPLTTYSPIKPLRLLYVSIINVYKHQWHVAEAVAKLKNEGFPITLELVGPAYKPALQRLQTTLQQIDPNSDFIHYRGSIKYADLPSTYHQADIFIFASSCENMPIILLEAMASGLPIACAQRGPMPEMLGDAGVYFDPENPEQIANALRSLLNDPELRARCAEKAFAKAQTYSWERCASETFDFLRRVTQDYKERI